MTPRKQPQREGPPLDRTSTACKVADYLRARIATGRLQPGDRIPELGVCAALSVSRSPVREALMQLAQEGLVTIVPYKGALVSPLERKRFEDLLHFRVALEEFAVSRAIEIAQDAEIAQLSLHIERLRGAAAEQNLSAAIEHDLALHEFLVSLAHNDLLSRAYAEMLNQLRLYLRLTITHYARIEDLVNEHEHLLEALRGRHKAEARSVIRAHIEHGFDAALELLERHTNGMA
ncbi:MAG: GntR family transcriptional regulator [bacterium]|nr:GntR family transcriptional regulator [bacterium]